MCRGIPSHSQWRLRPSGRLQVGVVTFNINGAALDRTPTLESLLAGSVSSHALNPQTSQRPVYIIT
jgi:hypothetical protein